MASAYHKEFSKYKRTLNLAAEFPLATQANLLALDLLERIFIFDRHTRISAINMLAHPFFAPIRTIGNETTAQNPYFFDELGRMKEMQPWEIKNRIQWEVRSNFPN